MISLYRQVALEGNISKETVLDNLNRGRMAGGDLIPWTISQQVSYSHPSLSISIKVRY